MRYLTGKRIVVGVTGLLVVLAIAGWFLFGSGLLNLSPMIGTPPGVTVDNECAAVYRKVTEGRFVAHRIMAEDGFKVEKALFLTGKEIKVNYNIGTAIQDGSHLCYVQVRGNIDVGSPFTNTLTIYSTGIALYDPDTLEYLEIGSGREILKVIVPTAGSNRPAAPQ